MEVIVRFAQQKAQLSLGFFTGKHRTIVRLSEGS
jgi:hypothetical protein